MYNDILSGLYVDCVLYFYFSLSKIGFDVVIWSYVCLRNQYLIRFFILFTTMLSLYIYLHGCRVICCSTSQVWSWWGLWKRKHILYYACVHIMFKSAYFHNVLTRCLRWLFAFVFTFHSWFSDNFSNQKSYYRPVSLFKHKLYWYWWSGYNMITWTHLNHLVGNCCLLFYLTWHTWTICL